MKWIRMMKKGLLSSTGWWNNKNSLLCGLSLQFIFFFRTGVFKTKLFDIRFSYKRCNFSRGCLLVKMASKTVTRSIRPSNRPVVSWSKKGKDKVTKVVTPIKKKTRHPREKIQTSTKRMALSKSSDCSRKRHEEKRPYWYDFYL